MKLGEMAKALDKSKAAKRPKEEPFVIAPYFDVLLRRLESGDGRALTAFGRHVHWGYWPEPAKADGTPEDYAVAAERLCGMICDAADIRDGMRVLDVGCGLGGTIASLNERFSNLDLVGVNIDPRQLKRARETVRPTNDNRIRFLEADACKLDFPPDSFDAVLAVECIFHFPSRAAFLSGAAACMKPEAKLALSDFVPPVEALPLLRRSNPGQDEATRLSFGLVNVLCTLEEYRELAHAADLTVLGCEDVTSHTMPTYAYLRTDQRLLPDRPTATLHERATKRLQVACREGYLQYSIVRFGR